MHSERGRVLNAMKGLLWDKREPVVHSGRRRETSERVNMGHWK